MIIGEVIVFQIEGNGQCLFEALWRSLSMYDDEDNLGTSESVSKETLMFTPYRLRLMTVYMMVFYCVGVGLVKRVVYHSNRA